ncbi:MAG: hypothetical protein IKC71_01335 [Clostridia bacterium]|nr:hypothetical protein [Clostridia bacterium]
MIDSKRVTLFLGHYGSGKTNVALNYALYLKNKGLKTAVYDLDIVNPYFRTLDGKSILDKEGIRLVVSRFANSNVDLPSLPSEAYAIIDDKTSHAVVDVGGDDRGALALGRYLPEIKKENNYEMLLVANKYRPETRTIEGLIEIKEEIERVTGTLFTGVVNNSNLGRETTEETVLSSIDFMQKFCDITKLPLKFTCVKRELSSIIIKDNKILPMDLIKYGSWQ